MPIGHAPVADSDFRTARQIGAQDIDYTFTDLARDTDGRAWVHVTAPDPTTAARTVGRRSVPVHRDHTAHTQAEPHWRTGLGVEPMICAPTRSAAATA